ACCRLPPRPPDRSRDSRSRREHFVDEVEVVVEAFAGVASQERIAGRLVVTQFVRGTRFHGREDVHQARMIAACGENLSNAIFFAEGLHLPDVLDCHTLFGCELLGMSGLCFLAVPTWC